MARVRTGVRGVGVRLLVASGLVAGGCALAAAGASAGPATYYASPSSTDTSGTCTVSAPCRLDHAIALAGAGDVVIVLPGTYPINYELQSSLPITIEGQPGQPRPVLAADPGLMSDTLDVSGGAVVRHLQIETNNDQGARTTALSIEGGTAEDLVVRAGSEDEKGEALSVKDSSSGTTVRTVLAINKAEGGEAVSFKDSATSPGTANVYNLTAISTSEDGEALSGNVATGTVWVKDSIAFGKGGSDISTKPGTQPLNLTYSDFRAADSSGYADQGGNILAAPVFVDASSGDYHEAETSPTVDAGASDSALTTTDLDGDPRVMGSAPDMGAYEYGGAAERDSGSPSGSELPDDTSTQLPPASVPVAGVSVALHHISGLVRVQLPGHRRFIRLRRGANVPVGSVVDVTHGAVVLTSAVNLHGASKSGAFHAGRFLVTQSTGARPTTNLRLVGGTFAGCSSSLRAAGDGQPLAGIARPRPRRRRVVRQLWGSDSGGSFVTIGNTASAAVRGTVWLTQDRCDGTLVRVLRGAVLVHDDVRGVGVLVRRGQAYLARAHR
jgi:hypothetical protein